MKNTVTLESLIFAAAHEGVATGRNGRMRVSGLRAWRGCGDHGAKFVTIEPWTSRGRIGNCRIVIPTSEVRGLIALLVGMLPRAK